MEEKTWSMAASRSGEHEVADFRCLHRTARGRIFHCPELRRLVIDFDGTCLVLRPREFHRLHLHLGRIAACALTRSRMTGGERIRLRDATGNKALILDLAGLEELTGLMEFGNAWLHLPSCQDVADSLGARPTGDPLSTGATRGYPFPP